MQIKIHSHDSVFFCLVFVVAKNSAKLFLRYLGYRTRSKIAKVLRSFEKNIFIYLFIKNTRKVWSVVKNVSNRTIYKSNEVKKLIGLVVRGLIMVIFRHPWQISRTSDFKLHRHLKKVLGSGCQSKEILWHNFVNFLECEENR